MRIHSQTYEAETINPLDVIEDIIYAQDWQSERCGRDEVAVKVPSGWCDFDMFFMWSRRLNALHLSCSIDIEIPDESYRQACELITLANERLWLGHFALWTDECLPMFRHTMLLDKDAVPNSDRVAELIEIALDECERFYPAFKYVIHDGKSVTEALDAAMLDVMGEA